MPLFRKRSSSAEDMPSKRGRGRPPKNDPEVTVPPSSRRQFRGREIKLSTTTAIIILLLALVPAVYFYKQNRDAKSVNLNQTQNSQNEVNDIVAKAGKHALLPTDETPTLATVTDPDKLKNQSFFDQAIRDDKVLIYNQAKRAILYRPSLDKIIETAPIGATKR